MMKVIKVEDEMRLSEDEIIVRKSRGNYRNNLLNPLSYYGGKWFLTNYRLYFKGNVTNLGECEESIPLDNIISIEAKHNDFLSSKLTFFLNNGSIIQLHVPKRKEWINDIGVEIKKIKKDIDDNWDINQILNTIKIPNKPKGWFVATTVRFLLFGMIVAIITIMINWMIE